MPVAFATILGEAIQEGRVQGDGSAAVAKFVGDFGNLFLNTSSMKGLADFFDAFGKQDAGYFAQSAAASVVPYGGLLANLARMGDAEVKDPEDWIEYVKARLPGMSGQVAPKLTQFGEPVERASAGISALTPLRVSQAKQDPILQEYQRLRAAGQKVGIGTVGETIKGVKLTPEEKRVYQEKAGQLLKAILPRILDNQAYQKLPPQYQAKVLNRLETKLRDAAAKQTAMQLTDFVERYKASRTGGPNDATQR
jgi:hypothetical protein